MTPPATPTSAPDTAPEESPVLTRVLALLEDQTRRFEAIEADLAATKARTASFRPMESSAPPPRGIKAQLAGMRNGEQREGISTQILVDVHGEKVNGLTLQQYPCRFEFGSRVRIDPGSARVGFPEGQTWGDVLAKLGIDGYGTVRKVYWLNDDGQWKYSVHVPGLTNGRPDGFYDSELLPA